MKCVVSQKEVITGHKLSQICDIVYTAGMQREQLKRCRLVYCKTDFVSSFLAQCGEQDIILVTGMSDIPVDKTLFSKKPKNVIKWYGENITHTNSALHSIPLGSTVASWVGNHQDADRKDLSSYVQIAETNEAKSASNLAYMNFSIGTQPAHRRSVYNFFKDKEWVTARECNYPTGCPQKCPHWLSVEMYAKEIYDHRLTICPLGNGVDTGRFWTSLYLGSIPVVPNHYNLSFYEELPFIVYDRLEDLTLEYLTSQLEKIEKRDFNLEKLTMSYWRKKLAQEEEK